MNKFAAVLHINDTSDNPQPTEPSFSDQFDERCGLSRTQRFIGFGTCFTLGWILNLMSLFAIGSIVVNPAKFAVLYTVGNCLAVGSSCFLWYISY